MRWLVAVVLVSILSASLAQASDDLEEGYGLMLTVREIGSCHTDYAMLGLSPGGRLDEGGVTIFDPFTPVHIIFPLTLDKYDIRPLDGDTTFSADIRWFGRENGKYELQLSFIDLGDENFVWSLPPLSPKVSLTDETSETQTFYVPLSYQPVYCYGQGDSQLTVDLGPQSVPEPGSIFVVGAGLITLLGRRRLNR